MGVVLFTLVASLVLIADCQSNNEPLNLNDDLRLSMWLNNVAKEGIATPATSVDETTKFNLSPNQQVASVACLTRDGRNGKCVPFYQCAPQISSKREKSARSGPRRNMCPSLNICCNEDDLELTTPLVRIGNPTDEETETSSPNKPVCGFNNSDAFNDSPIYNNLIENSASKFAEFPWMVAILKKSGTSVVWSQTDYVGGGSLIHPSVVLTAAHKLAPMGEPFMSSQLKCRAGEWDTQTVSEPHPHQERDVERFIVHTEYYRTSLYNDIALLIMAQPFQLDGAPHMGTACLAPAPPPPGRLCYSMGWGRADPKDRKKYASVLKKVPLHPIKKDVCQDMLRTNSRLGPFFEVHQSLTCAIGDTNVDTCRGDGGSSLVCAVSDDPAELRFAVHGMVAYGIKCFDPNVPGMYADTAHLKTWVDDKMQEEGFGSEYYTL